MLGIIFFGCNVITFFLMAAIYMGISKPSRGKLFGIYIPPEKMSDERVTEVIQRYKTKNKIWFWISFLTMFLQLYPTDYFSIILSYFLVWTTAIIVFKMKLIANVNSELIKLKRELGWYDAVRDVEENYWHGGMFYYNPNSKKVFVNSSLVGNSSSVNLATKAGRNTMIFSAVLIILLLVPSWVLILKDDFVEPKIHISNTELTVKSAFHKVNVKLSDIEQVTVTEISGGNKVNGSGTARYARGVFYYSEYGNCDVFKYRSTKEVILIQIKNRRPLILNMPTYEETMSLYQEIMKAMP
ncbi:PH domain-containing protein [Fusibacter bizertensis]